jgi:myo-inositol catabolism protein IolC
MEPATGYLTNGVDRDTAVETIAMRYLGLIERWKENELKARR